MKTPPDDPDRNALLDGVLADDGWQALNAEVKARALGAFRAHRRQRRLLAWGGSAVAACALAVTGLNFVLRPYEAAPASVASKPKTRPSYLTEEQLMAYFPPGSCTIAEIDGERRFIVLDPEIAAHGYPLN
jgi:hypothetical protein